MTNDKGNELGVESEGVKVLERFYVHFDFSCFLLDGVLLRLAGLPDVDSCTP